MKHPEMLLSKFETASFLIEIATFARALGRYEIFPFLRLFSGLRVLFYHEGQDAGGTYKASLVAQRAL